MRMIPFPQHSMMPHSSARSARARRVALFSPQAGGMSLQWALCVARRFWGLTHVVRKQCAPARMPQCRMRNDELADALRTFVRRISIALNRRVLHALTFCFLARP
jgi:hypothetical protein